MKIRPPRYHREIPQRYRLEAAKTKSGKVYFPPRKYYPGGESARSIQMKDTGKLLTWTVVHTAAAEYSDLTPFPLGIVELDGGGRITAMIADCDPKDLKFGMKVRVTFRRIRSEGDEGLLCYGYKVVPA